MRISSLSPSGLLRRLVFELVGRPLLLLHFRLYRKTMNDDLFPQDELIGSIAGPDTERLLFVGDITVAGYGVLRHGMGTAAQTAALLHARTGSGMTWSSLTAFDLTAKKVATLPCDSRYDIDRVVFVLGIPDVLLFTSERAWERHLRTVFARTAKSFGDDTQIVFAEIPPMHDFQEMPALMYLLIKTQVDRLNAVSERVLAAEGARRRCLFVPAPGWSLPGSPIERRFTFKELHQQWALALSDAALSDTALSDAALGDTALGDVAAE